MKYFEHAPQSHPPAASEPKFKSDNKLDSLSRGRSSEKPLPFIESSESVSRDKTNNLLKYDTAYTADGSIRATTAPPHRYAIRQSDVEFFHVSSSTHDSIPLSGAREVKNYGGKKLVINGPPLVFGCEVRWDRRRCASLFPVGYEAAGCCMHT